MALPLLFQFKHCTIISLSGTSFSRSDLISIQALYDYKSYKYSYVYNLTSFQFKHCTIIRRDLTVLTNSQLSGIIAHPFKGKTRIACRTHSGAADGVGIKLQRLRALTEDNQ